MMILVAVALAVAAPASARQVFVVSQPNGTVKIVDPQDTFKYKLTHPWRFVTPKNAPAYQQSAEGFGESIKPGTMQRKTRSLVRNTTHAVTSTANKVTDLPVLRIVTRPVKHLFGIRNVSS